MLSQPSQRFHGLDHLRAFAILSVFLFHYFIITHGQPEWLPDFAKFAWTGVDLFFVLSGFLISSQLFSQIVDGQKISFIQFFLKRFFRIIPAYWATLVIYFCFPLFREKESLPALWKFLTFTQNFDLNLKDFGTFSHAWSLCAEEHFYLCLPLILIFYQFKSYFKKAYLLLIVLFLAGFAIRIYSYNILYAPNSINGHGVMFWYKYIYYPTYCRLDALLAGVSIAALVHFLPAVWERILRYGNFLFVMSLAVLTGAYFVCYEQQTFASSVFGFPLVAIGYGLMVAAAISPICFLYKWQSKINAKIATLSYAIYLTHKGVIHITQVVVEDYYLNDNLMLVICTFTCICGGFLLHYSVEKPFMKMRNQLLLLK